MFKQGLFAVASIAIVLVSGSVMGAEAALKGEDSRFSYAVGVRVAQSLKAKGVTTLDTNAFSQAVADVIKERKLKLSDAEMDQAFQTMDKKRAGERAAAGARAKTAGEKFLAENKGKAGVTTLATGLQYRVIREGNGVKPTASDMVEVHYRGRRIDGTEFDSSYSRGEPASFPVEGVIQGWQQVLQLMPVGSKWEVVIPSDLAYGEAGAGAAIGPNETLVFDIELLKVEAPEPR